MSFGLQNKFVAVKNRRWNDKTVYIRAKDERQRMMRRRIGRMRKEQYLKDKKINLLF